MNRYFGQYIKNCRYTHPKCQNISCNYYDKLPRNILTFRVIHEQGSPLLLVVYLLYDCPNKINHPRYLVDNPLVSPLPNPSRTPRARVYENSLRLFRRLVHLERELLVVLLFWISGYTLLDPDITFAIVCYWI